MHERTGVARTRETFASRQHVAIVSSDADRPAQREILATLHVEAMVDRIETHRIVLAPGQATARHYHAGGVIGYVVDGGIAFALEGGTATTLRAGDAFFEPAGQVVDRFDNLSTTQSATFLASYPLTGDQTPITMIER